MTTEPETPEESQAEQEAIERATALEAMQAAYTFLTTHGHAEELCTRMLAECIDKEMRKHEKPRKKRQSYAEFSKGFADAPAVMREVRS